MNCFNKPIYILTLGTVLPAISFAQLSASRNYVSKTIVNKPGVSTAAQVDALPPEHRQQSVSYIDGLGRPVQTVVVQGSGDKRDLVTPVAYDIYGRVVTKYLPYVDAGSTAYGSFRENAYTDQSGFYSPANTTVKDVARDPYPYEQRFLEFSPMNRPLEMGAAGQSWQPASGHAVRTIQSQNTPEESVMHWTITGNALPVAADYQAGDLYKTITIDGQGRKKVEYRDRENKVVLRKVQLQDNPEAGHNGWLCTYYVFDDFNRLRYVIPPKAVTAISSSWSLSLNGVLEELCFVYTYDAKGRMITKKVPGAAVVEMVYDSRDRLVFSNDGNLRDKHQWMTTFYDARNRPVMTALYTDASATRTSLQAQMDNAVNTNIDLTYTFPGTEELELASFDGKPLYQARKSITLMNGFDTQVSGQTDLRIDSLLNGGTQVTTVANPLPGIAESALTRLTYTFYDDYTYAGVLPAMPQDFSVPQAGSSTTAVPVTAVSKMTRGLVTGTRVRVLGTDQWLTTTPYYTDKGQPLQIISENNRGGKDVATNLYDFEGKILSSYVRNSNPASAATPETRILTVMNYDHSGRLLDISKQLNNTGPLKKIVQNQYNTLGQLTTKTLGDNLDNLVYDYNIRGWLLGANRSYVKSVSGGNYFGFELAYDQPASVIDGSNYIKPQYNGNIAGTSWRSKGDQIRRKYDYSYDNTNRLTGADFNQQNTEGAPWTQDKANFTVNNLTYDENGNILTMKQKGVSAGEVIDLDDLKYGYNGLTNKLHYVTDKSNNPQSTLGDFKEITKDESQDYWYDLNGNMTRDNNKNIASISYNHLNLPERISIPNKGTIRYSYNAAGIKLRKTVNDSTVTPALVTTTDYLSGFEYKNDTLQHIAHEEGRIRAVVQPNTPVAFVYDYFEKDHLGNIRVVLTEQTSAATYVATMESGSAAKESALFSNLEDTRSPKPVGYPSGEANNKAVAKLNAQGGGKKIGPSIVLRVMAGDTIQLGAKAFYKSGAPANKSNNTAAPETMLADLIAAFGGNATGEASHGGPAPIAQTPFNANFYNHDYQRLKDKNPDEQKPNKPKAYLNFVLFDEQFKLVEQNSGVKQLKEEPDQLQTLTQDKMPISKSGFLYVYTSNESAQDVYFDDVVVTHATGPVLEETHYYPFGLTMAGISSNALMGINSSENQKKYNGNELQSKEFSDDSGLEWFDFNARTYDQQLGRFMQIDPWIEVGSQEMLTPYQFSYNNPVRYNDPDGRCPICPVAVPIAVEAFEAFEAIWIGYRSYATITHTVILLSEGVGKDGARPHGKEVAPAAKDETAIPLPAPGKAIDEKSKPKVAPEALDKLERMGTITPDDKTAPDDKRETKPKPKPTEDLNRTAQDVISKERQGGINREFPEQYRDKTLREIQKDANAGNKAAQKAQKLLRDGRFKKTK
ncbi:DUF6443 domain-containing protein [Chitinophaga sp. HK235]|uniref:DUF6443 domain-containing protein n=1 Tax=Chitinophaga sp. HK235 TaxID=2952571 RepID=UPI001BA544AA|nr:DUF6443 domain-containing protein [Chitinophaga sp. HK235]